jgi:hypothetical protein
VLTRVDGAAPSPAEQRQVVLVDLWATWCGLHQGAPHLQSLSEKFGSGDFLMLGVVLESGDPKEIRRSSPRRRSAIRRSWRKGTKESFGPFLGYPTSTSSIGKAAW